MHDQDETVLAGGNLSHVVKVGNTVRRPAGSWTPMVHRLLVHVRSRGFHLGPVPHGLDEKGREVLSFIAGETLTKDPWPQWVWSDTLLLEAARSLAAYHEAVGDFRPAVVESRLGAAQLRDDEIVCHNDFSPYNSVFRDGHLVGIIDWDIVCPRRPSWDLAFVAWHWVPLHAPSPDLAWRPPIECGRRLRMLADAYGLNEKRPGLVHEVIARIKASRTGIIERARSGDEAFARLEREGHADEMGRAIAFVRSIEGLLQGALVN